MSAASGRLAATAVLLAALAFAAAAFAQTRSAAGVDPAGDVEGALDVRRVALVIGRDGRLRGEVTLRSAWDTAALRTKDGPSGTICLRIYSARDPESEPPDHLVCAQPAPEGDALIGRVYRDRANGLPRKVADAVVQRPSARTVYLRFTRTSIGRPASVRFGAETVARAPGCPQPPGCRDLGPDAPDTLYLALRRARR